MESEIKFEAKAGWEDPVNCDWKNIQNKEFDTAIKVEPKSMDVEFPETMPFEVGAACTTSNTSSAEEPLYKECEIKLNVEPDLFSESPESENQGIQTVSSNDGPLALIERPSIEPCQTKTEVKVESNPSGGENVKIESNKKFTDSAVSGTAATFEPPNPFDAKKHEGKAGLDLLRQEPSKTESKDSMVSSLSDNKHPHNQANDEISIKVESDLDVSSKTTPKEKHTAPSVSDAFTRMSSVQPCKIKTEVKLEPGSDSHEPLKPAGLPEAVNSEEDAVMKAKEHIQKLASVYYKSERQGGPSAADPYTEFEHATRHPECAHSLEKLKNIAERIPARLGVRHRVFFIRKCYIYGMDPDTWDWDTYNRMQPDPPTPHPRCELTSYQVKQLAMNAGIKGEERGEFMIRVYLRGEDPNELLRQLSRDDFTTWCGYIMASWTTKYTMLVKGYPHPQGKRTLKELKAKAKQIAKGLPHPQCMHTLNELTVMAEQIPESFGIGTRVKFIHRCYVSGMNPALEDWTQYSTNPCYEYEGLPAHKNCTHSLEELKRMAEKIPESVGPWAQGHFIGRCYRLGLNPFKEDWTKYKRKAPKLIINNPFKVSSSTLTDFKLPEFEGIPPHPKCKYSLDAIKKFAEQIPESFGPDTRVHFIRRCYKYGHNPAAEDWTKYFEPTFINPPVNKDDPYAEFENISPNTQCIHSLKDIKQMAEKIPESFGIESRVKFVRRCYRQGKDPATEDWTQYNIDPYHDIKDHIPHPKNKNSFAVLKRMSERIPQSYGVMPRIQFVRRCYLEGKNPSQEDWTKYPSIRLMQSDVQSSFGTGNTSDPPPQNPVSHHHPAQHPQGAVSMQYPCAKFKYMSPRPECKHSLDEIKSMAESQFPDSMEHRMQYIRECYQFGKPPKKIPGTDSINESRLPICSLGNDTTKFKQHPRCTHSLEELESMALTLPSWETMKRFLFLTYAQGENPTSTLNSIKRNYHLKSSNSESGSKVQGDSFEWSNSGSSTRGSKRVINVSSSRFSHLNESCSTTEDVTDPPFKSTGGLILNNPPTLPPLGGQPFDLLSIPPPTVGVQSVCPVGSAAYGHSLPPLPPPFGTPSSNNTAVFGHSLPPVLPPLRIPPPSNGSPTPSGRRALRPIPAGDRLSTSPASANLWCMPPLNFRGPLGNFPLTVPLEGEPPQHIPDPRNPLSSVPAGQCLLPVPPRISVMGETLPPPPFSNPPPPDDVPCSSTKPSIAPPMAIAAPPNHTPQYPTKISNSHNSLTINDSGIRQIQSHKFRGTQPKLGQNSTVCLKRNASHQAPIPPKKPLLETSKTDSHVSEDTSPPVYIVASDYPNVCLSEEQMDIIESSILEAILDVDDASAKPTFKGSFRSNGQYGFVCDDFTKKWLFEFLKTFQPWSDLPLKMISNYPTKVCANAVLPMCKDEDEKILRFIGKQNKGLNVDKWEVIERWDSSGYKTCMNLMIDEGSAKVLESCDHINFKIGSGKIVVGRKETSRDDTGHRSRPEIVPPETFGTSENEMNIEHHGEMKVPSSCGFGRESEQGQPSGESCSEKNVQSCLSNTHREYAVTRRSSLYRSASPDDKHSRKRTHSSKRRPCRSPSPGRHYHTKNSSSRLVRSSWKHGKSSFSRYDENRDVIRSRRSLKSSSDNARRHDVYRAQRHVQSSSDSRAVLRSTQPLSRDRRSSCETTCSYDYDLLRSRASGTVSSKQNLDRCKHSLPSPINQALEKSARRRSPDAFDLSEGELTPSPPPFLPSHQASSRIQPPSSPKLTVENE